MLETAMSLRTAAIRLGTSSAAVLEMVERGELRGKRIGRRWAISKEDVEALRSYFDAPARVDRSPASSASSDLELPPGWDIGENGEYKDDPRPPGPGNPLFDADIRQPWERRQLERKGLRI